MARRKQRRPAARNDGRLLNGAWRTDYVDGVLYAFDDDMRQASGVIPAASIPCDPPDFDKVPGTMVVDADRFSDERYIMAGLSATGAEHKPRLVLVRDKILRSQRHSQEETLRYWAKRDKLTQEQQREQRAKSYGDEHRAKAQYLGRAKAYYDGISARKKEKDKSDMASAQKRALLEAVEAVLPAEALPNLRQYLRDGGSLELLAHRLDNRVRA